MKVKILRYGDDGYYETDDELAFHVSKTLNSRTETNVTERNHETINNVLAAFGNLVDKLAEKGLLNGDDVKNILEDYETGVVFVKKPEVLQKNGTDLTRACRQHE